jgi:DNA-binding transcriptional regulator YdaS (Cro superfamily)
VPPELAEQIKTALHLLHASPPIVEQNAPPRSAFPLPPARPSRIERTESGGYTLIYDEPQS